MPRHGAGAVPVDATASCDPISADYLRILEGDSKRLGGDLHLLVGFFVGCVLDTAALMYLGDWTWSLPAALYAVAVATAS